MDPRRVVESFILGYLREIGADLAESDGVWTAAFPPGRKRRYGRQRRFTFDPDRRREHVELVEAGSPFLKMLLLDAKPWGSVGALSSPAWPAGTLLYTFHVESYSSVRKRTHFVAAALEPGAAEPRVVDGFPSAFEAEPAEAADAGADVGALESGLERVVPAVERAARSFGQEAVRESHEAFQKAVQGVQHYFQGVRQETFLEEARIRKRLGEIQSKLYFTEDGLRELKLQREQERLTRDLHELRKRNTRASDTISQEREGHIERQRRRHEPKLRIRLVAATRVCAPAAPPPAAGGVAPASATA